MNMHNIGLRISELRKQQDMTQLELADKMGVSYQAISSWERGATMPDISRLPEISQILRVSIDELLGNETQAEIVKNVLQNQQSDAYTGESSTHMQHHTEVTPTLSLQDIADVAHILKPSQVDNLVENAEPASISLHELANLAPFVSKEILGHLALQACEAGEIHDLYAIAPFLDKDILDQLAHEINTVNGISALTGLAPFVRKQTLAELAMKAYDNTNDVHDLLHEICHIAPFLDRDMLDQLALKAVSVGGSLEGLESLAPFVSKETLTQIASKAIAVGNISELYGIAPFLDKELLGELFLNASKKRQQ